MPTLEVGGMRTPLSSCCIYPTSAPSGDGDRCIDDSVGACGTSSRLVCDSVSRRRDDEGEMNVGDEYCGGGGVGGWEISTTTGRHGARVIRGLTPSMSEFARDGQRRKRLAI